ncbi:ABC transporter ATP-binding protein [Intestinibacillus massiliensis]|uniref:ABC transporter ATP-binding protein n=1 Tax=Intestinibacillus massiliensis TaxID=1871029 RepID=UPI000B34CA08|nr:ABC transporter ATP-binding protein [Intestinibacillus massiliensis]
MIQAAGATKRFGDINAIHEVSAEIRDGSVFGLIGSNGAGKSTFLRMLAGILRPDAGRVTIDGQDIYENVPLKGRCFYISDEQYFFSNCTPDEMRDFYKKLYPKFDGARYRQLMEGFGLDGNRKIRTFSKGMKKQVSVICGVCAGVDYLFCDETFDGLDPVVRQAVKGLFAADVAERGMTPIIASHNLRELEDICDHVGLLHKGGILFSRDLDDMKLGIHKLQCIFDRPFERTMLDGVEILQIDQRGSLYTITARGSRELLQNRVAALQPIFFELLPLSLEEIFISETEVVGYDIKKLIL